ncbi:CHAT domain-containing protein [Granulicella sp. S156]|uniref:CHAT domain-containing protein n=1 Tax=Granulicella sp. S156 TaxID=1747224 RepID=UPI0021103F1B|nr:CHAT domain-containing protein [Granulicella sp. S156]
MNALEGRPRSFSPSEDLTIKQEILLSLAHARLGQPQLASEELQKAQHLADATRSPLESEVARTEGLLEYRSGQQSSAESSFRRSLEFARRQKDLFIEATDLLNLGAVALQTEHFDEALDRFKASAEISSSIHANLFLEEGLGNAGWAYYSLGDYEKALVSFQQAEIQAKSLGATDNEILWLQSAGLSLYHLGGLKQAQSCYEEALRAADASHDTARKAVTDTSLGQLLLQLGQPDAAKARVDEALKAAQQIGDKASELDALFLQGQIAARTSNGADTERIFSQVYHDAAGTPSLKWETENAFADLYASRHDVRQAGQWYRRAIKTFETQRSSVQDEELRLPFFANGDELYRDYAEFLIASYRSDEALQFLDGARARTLKEGLGEPEQAAHVQPETPSHTARRLNAVILFYSLGPQRSYLWAIDRNGTHLFGLPPEAEITARVKSYQADVLKSHDPLHENNLEAQWLYKTLVAPAEALIPKESHVFIVPSGSLNDFNMEMLLKPGPSGSQGETHYWIEDVSLSTASSIQLLSRLSPGKEIAAKNLLLIGDPTTAGNGYPPLPNAASEVQSVQKYFTPGDRTVLTQTAAVPVAYATSNPEQYSYIHFVAHGIASSLRPLDSAIVLSPPHADPDNFKLYARDIIHRPLHARLVTISACYGSGLRNYDGEGLVGLSWAFLRAGAHQVIGAVWEVNDSSTPQLMEQMYHGLAQGEQPDQALRAAKLSMLHSQGVFRKPLYWAAFQLYTGS